MKASVINRRLAQESPQQTMIPSFPSMLLSGIFSTPVPFWSLLFVLSLGALAAVGLYQYWKISTDLRKENEDLHSQHKSAEALLKKLEYGEKTLQAKIEHLQAENNRLEDQIAELTELLHAEKRRLEQQLAELTTSGPRLHGIWNNSQTFWHVGQEGTERVMQIGGRIFLTSSNTDEVLHLLAGYIDNRRLDIYEPVSVRPDVIEDEQIVLCMSLPPEVEVTCSFTATIVLEDHQNRLHRLPEHTFQPTELAPPWPSKQP